MKVFVSSTVFDLLDVRAEVKQLLLELRLRPLMSEYPDTDFDITLATNSIQVCLDNIAASDFVVVILNQRYGPSLKKAGFPDQSATHLEFDRAVALKKPLLVLVRDRLFADFGAWGKDVNARLFWVHEPRDYGLFTMLESHRKLTTADVPNWLATFEDSVQLKEILRKQLRTSSGRALAKHLWDRRELPWFELSLTQSIEQGMPAFDLVVTLRSEQRPIQNMRVQLVDGHVEWGRVSGNLGLPRMTHDQKVKQRYRAPGATFDVANLSARIQYVTEFGYGICEEYSTVPSGAIGGAILMQIRERMVTYSPEL